MPDTVPTLPLPLLLLVHLQILEYPHRNEPEYDHQLFDAAVRGLRDRTKTMEDVCCFLVGKLERKDAKVVLPTYPCLQPSDKTAFRTSLAKYLDGLRNLAIYPSSTTVAWWWKDVVAQTTFEECAGERFERLLVALSTHSLLRNASGFDLNVLETGVKIHQCTSHRQLIRAIYRLCYVFNHIIISQLSRLASPQDSLGNVLPRFSCNVRMASSNSPETDRDPRSRSKTCHLRWIGNQYKGRRCNSHVEWLEVDEAIEKVRKDVEKLYGVADGTEVELQISQSKSSAGMQSTANCFKHRSTQTLGSLRQLFLEIRTHEAKNATHSTISRDDLDTALSLVESILLHASQTIPLSSRTLLPSTSHTTTVDGPLAPDVTRATWTLIPRYSRQITALHLIRVRIPFLFMMTDSSLFVFSCFERQQLGNKPFIPQRRSLLNSKWVLRVGW